MNHSTLSASGGFPFYASFPSNMEKSKGPERGQLSESQQDQELERFAVIRPFLEDGVPLTEIARERALPLRTVRRRVKRYREAGLNGLARKLRSDKGERRDMPGELKRLISVNSELI